ncbi:MAG: hypothetical protein Kow00127_13320 [Bacteroidales bacterium]
MVKRLKPDKEPEGQWSIIALATSQNDYRAAYLINSALGFDLRRGFDFGFYHDSLVDVQYYPFYRYQFSDRPETWFLIANRNGERPLVQAFRTTDFFLIARECYDADRIKSVVSGINKIQGLWAHLLQEKDLRKFYQILEDLELHLIGS